MFAGGTVMKIVRLGLVPCSAFVVVARGGALGPLVILFDCAP